MADLTEQLEASLQGRVVSRWSGELWSEADCISAHAQVARACRERKRFRLVEITDDPSPSNDTE